MQTLLPEVWVVLPVDGPEDAVEEALAAVRVEVVEGAAEDEPVGEAHRVDQAGHLLEADPLQIYACSSSTVCLSFVKVRD